jgi:hypothetical protein
MQWRPCPNFDDYEVSENGDVRRVTTAQGSVLGRVLKTNTDSKGRLNLILRREGASVHVRPSRLVCEAWWGAPPFKGAETCHGDGNPSNNHFSNLRWGTRKDNCADMVRHGTRRCGEKHHNARLSAKDIDQIRKRAAAGERQQTIADDYGIRQSQVSRIASKVRWHLATN